MSQEVDTQEILKRLKALEEENARLRKGTNANATKPLTVTESDYNGFPTLVFEGPCKPFAVGLKKLNIIKQAWPQVELLLDKHAKNNAGQSSIDDDDKI